MARMEAMRLVMACRAGVWHSSARAQRRRRPAQGKSQAELRKAFVGTWRLVSITGGANPAARGKPTGLIIYDAHGNMAAQIQPDRQRPTYTGTPTAGTTGRSRAGYTAYFGTYTIDEKAGIVTHHRQGQLDSGAVDFVRKFELTDGGNRIVLTPVGAPAPPHSS